MRAAGSSPIGEWTKRLVVCDPVSIQQCSQLAARISEHDKPLPVHHTRVALAEGRGDFFQVRNRGGGILVAFLDVNDLSVVTDEPLISQHPGLVPRRLDHLAGQFLKIGQLAGFDSQFDPPRNFSSGSCHHAPSGFLLLIWPANAVRRQS